MKILIFVLSLYILIPSQTLASQITEDLIFMWNAHYDESGIRKNYSNRKNFQQYANYVENSLEKLKIEFEENGKSNKLPIIYPKHDKYLHIIVGAMAIAETNVKPWLKGKRGEVGVLQVWGVARGGFKKRVIQNNSDLGFYLGIRWLLHCLYLSKKEIVDIKSYGKALSYYTCGLKCKGRAIRAVRKRLNIAYKFQGGIMKPLERLIEAVSYQLSDDEAWWEVFDSKSDALAVINNASKSDDDEMKEYIVDLYYGGIVLDEQYNVMFKKLIKELRGQLKNG